MKKLRPILLALLLVAVLLLASVSYNSLKGSATQEPVMTLAPAETTAAATEPTEAETEPTQPQPAPGFTVYDPAGNPVSLSDMVGKPVIINFWATWCGYCVSEMPEFQAAFQQYGDQIHFMMINVTDGFQETQQKAMDFMAESGYTFPVYYDLDLSASYAYGVNAMPVTYFLDNRGNFVAWGQGALTEAAIAQGISMVLESAQ